MLALAFSPEGEIAITGAEDQSVRLWDIIPPSMEEVLEWGTENRFVPELDCDDLLRFRMTPTQECLDDD